MNNDYKCYKFTVALKIHSRQETHKTDKTQKDEKLIS